MDCLDAQNKETERNTQDENNWPKLHRIKIVKINQLLS